MQKIKFDKKKMHEIEEITNTIYYYEEEYTSIATLLFIIDDLLEETKSLNEKIEHLENDINDNYRPISVAEQVGVSNSDFI